MERVEVTAEPIEVDRVLSTVAAPEDGAVLLFLGVVRDHNDGRPVTGIDYEAYEEMAREVLDEIVAEASERWGTDRIAVVHRTGTLEVGEVSVAIAVSTPHREEAYEASRWLIERIKERLPIWKREHYVDGERRWVPGRRPPVPETGGAP
ncbi:MAG: molybdenum cofactor biosynthesis protein MoaE [Gemmatimonadetes bacterium]|nr:molybdenum cofactor biosynthesis protein MoaE [Gemmatimonadota bacterium]NIP78733.1 molybdenum cofactor biosynthesis protein MoaE [Gemmatimonadota bacterium]NIR79743.1 molybdenum cofactor biosynthesis protein MoaE [Gemmatimonadota bacterium]NIU32262.1 molybdenum cofactor biosynthesis protein MoaE [Gemmatimonadota bacterium]NIU36803.1 molybdenum cofactor biosynthesis protein MoaE [Gemmatimonadota bacterium]